jgi:hypothetical protein
MEAMN